MSSFIPIDISKAKKIYIEGYYQSEKYFLNLKRIYKMNFQLI